MSQMIFDTLQRILKHQEQKPIWPAWRWWAILAIVVVVAGYLRYTGYDFSLPFVDHPDEPSHVIAAQMIIDTGSAKPIGMQGYPPGMMTVNYLLLRWVQPSTEPMTNVLHWSRLVTATFGVLCTITIALLGYRVGTSASGLFAAAIWAIQPIAVTYSHIAIPDTYLVFFTAFSLLSSLTGTLYDRDHWSVIGIFSLFLAILFKYQAIFVLPLVLAMPLIRLVDETTDRAGVWRLFAANLSRAAIFLAWLILLYPSLQASDSPGSFEGSPERLGIPGFDVLTHNATVIFPYLAIFWAIGLTGLSFLLWPKFRESINLIGLTVLLSSSLLWVIGMSFFGEPKPHQFLAMGAFLIVIWDIGIQGWVAVARVGLTRFQRLKLYAYLPYVVASLIVAVSARSMFNKSTKYVHDLTLPDRRNDIAAWADTSLTPGLYVATDDNHKTFNRAWGGYNGINDFSLAMNSVLTDRPIQEWRDLGVLYGFVTYGRYQRMQSSPEGERYLDQMVLLKTYSPSEEFRGPSVTIFRIYPMQYQVTGEQLGPIQLIGYDMDRTEVSPGDEIHFRLYWRSLLAADGTYQVYNHLIPMDSRGEPLAQADGIPLFDTRRDTSTWNDPAEILVSRDFVLPIGKELLPGMYRLITGFYRSDTGVRLMSPSNDDYLMVTNLLVIPAP